MVVRNRRLDRKKAAAKIYEKSIRSFMICDRWSTMNRPLFIIAIVLIAVRQLSAWMPPKLLSAYRIKRSRWSIVGN